MTSKLCGSPRSACSSEGRDLKTRSPRGASGSSLLSVSYASRHFRSLPFSIFFTAASWSPYNGARTLLKIRRTSFIGAEPLLAEMNRRRLESLVTEELLMSWLIGVAGPEVWSALLMDILLCSILSDELVQKCIYVEDDANGRLSIDIVICSAEGA